MKTLATGPDNNISFIQAFKNKDNINHDTTPLTLLFPYLNTVKFCYAKNNKGNTRNTNKDFPKTH